MEAFSNLMNRKRTIDCDWKSIPQPIPLVKVVAQPIHPGSSTVRYVATGITQEAEKLLLQLSAPLYMVAFAGFGRSGKSYTASLIRKHITGNDDYMFSSAPGNVPITHGIDMMVFENPGGGHVVFLDCEGGANHNQTALPFVIGLAARMASRMFIFERGCFTTAGLDTVMQGHATTKVDTTSITKDIVFVENMTINESIPNDDLLRDLLTEEDGDENTNRMRRLIKQKFNLEFNKLPFNMGENQSLHEEVCKEMGEVLMESLKVFEIGGVPGDGSVVVQMVNELISQIRGGGNRFNMISATEALVSNMASEAANTVWIEFVEKTRKQGNHPVQINGRKHVRTIMREVEGVASGCVIELEQFIGKLEPAEAAAIGMEIWNRNYHNFQADIRSAYQRKADELQKYSQWNEKISRWIKEIVINFIAALSQIIRFARFSATMVLMSNYYLWKNGLTLLGSMASGAVQGVMA